MTDTPQDYINKGPPSFNSHLSSDSLAARGRRDDTVKAMANLPPSFPFSMASSSNDRNLSPVEQLVLDICDPELRENAIRELSKVSFIIIIFSLRNRTCFACGLWTLIVLGFCFCFCFFTIVLVCFGQWI